MIVIWLQTCVCVSSLLNCPRVQRQLCLAAGLHSCRCWQRCWHHHLDHTGEGGPFAWLAAAWSGRYNLHSNTGQPSNYKKSMGKYYHNSSNIALIMLLLKSGPVLWQISGRSVDKGEFTFFYVLKIGRALEGLPCKEWFFNEDYILIKNYSKQTGYE